MTAGKEKHNYASAGVDIDAGNRAVDLMRERVRNTWGPQVLTDLGSFGGLFALGGGYREPVLAAGADGVGTKLKIAFMADKHDTVGIDAVAMCVNDVLVQGAKPLFFLDYIAAGKIFPEKIAAIVSGVCEGCRQAGCALIGGETAEMPGMYAAGEYDIAGFTVGVVEKAKIIDGSAVRAGDQLVGLPSSGLHSNGFSLVRKLLFEVNRFEIDAHVPEIGTVLSEELLKPTRIYVPVVLKMLEEVPVAGMAHITGGGITENLVRVLPQGCSAQVKAGSWERPPVFSWLQELGGIEEEEMYRTFNNGIGFILVVRRKDTERLMQLAAGLGEATVHIGEVVPGDGKVIIT